MAHLIATQQAVTYEPVLQLPPLAADQVAALREHIALHGVLVPIVVDSDGRRRKIIDGNYRKQIADQLGYTCPEVVEAGLSAAEQRLLARALNLARRHLSGEEKRQLIAEQLEESPGRSNRWIGKRLGVSHHTVQAVRSALTAGGQIAHLATVRGEDGKHYPIARGRSIIGDGGNRQPFDFYRTPRSAVEALLARERFRGTIWEPAAGDGAIARVLKQHGHRVHASDIGRGVDFLTASRSDANIVTNPPYSLATEFVLHAKARATSKIALLLKLDFLHGTSRYELFRDQAFPLKTVYVFCRRLQFGPLPGNPMISHAWFVWAKRHRGGPQLDWIGE